ncbi:hypothetical protein K439DRAFT_284242 [Ramaria rubella]|nr:hypothetical protein K439DRAFT_284242 [Ramaria rubella]
MIISKQKLLLIPKDEDLLKSRESLRTAALCESAGVETRYVAARFWSTLYPDPDGSGIEAYQTALGLLPRLVALDLDLESRQQEVASNNDGLVSEAAAYAIRSQFFSKAIEFVEEGRSIFWSQALKLRAPTDKFEPDLAKSFRSYSRELEQRTLVPASWKSLVSPEGEALGYHNLNAEWLATVEAMRKSDKFRDFLLPKSYATLSAAAMNGPIVILIPDKVSSNCDALIVRYCKDPIHVPLPEFTLHTAKRLIRLIRTLPNASLPLAREARTMIRKLPGAGNADGIFRTVLSTLWKFVAHPILQALNLKKTPSPPRIWWLCIGLFASLPIHAAGIYDVPSLVECVGDYVISSYTPTLSALLTPLPEPTETFKMLVAVDEVRLEHTVAELHKINNHVPSGCLVGLGIPGAPANVEDVLSHLQTASIVHFACHGIQDTENPLESALLLKDRRLKLSQIMELSMPKASLVFLSACQTARGDETLPDESMHLAAAMLFAGFRGAVATLWSMEDCDGPMIADRFYHHFFSTTKPAVAGPDTTRAAHALHLAVADLRDKLRAEQAPSQFVRWVPFLHMGL